MKIVLLAHALRSSGGLVGGRNFIRALAAAAPQHEYLITIPANCGYESIALPQGSRYHVLPQNLSPLCRFKAEKKDIPGVVKRFGADVVLGLGNHGLMNIDCPQAIWIRNGYLIYPGKHYPGTSLKERLQICLQRHHLKKVLKTTDLLFCQTPVMRQRISKYYNYNAEDIKILPNATSFYLKSSNDDRANKKPDGVAEDEFNCLILTKYYNHKNPEIILETCLNFAKDMDGIRFITTVEEGNGPHARRYIEKISRNQDLNRRIKNIGPIIHEDLESYYKNIQLVIMPTLIESFSVTYLEAMAYGVPILTTDLDFARYICDSAAVYYDPWKKGDFVEKLLKLKSDAEFRNKLTAAGYNQLKKFPSNWETMVKTAIADLENLVDKVNKQ